MTTLNMIRGREVILPLTNQSGGAIIAGDVVIVSAAADESFTTTTSAAYNSTRVGVALESIAAAASGRILLEGYAPLVNVSASATRGHYLLTHTVAKQATSQAGYAAGAFGQILKAGTTPSAMIFPVAQVGSSGVGGTSGSTDNAVIRADGTGGATVQSSAATIDDSGTVNIPTGQTYNINNTPHTHASAGALVLLEQHTASDSATLDFTTFISAAYDEYQFEMINIIPAADTASFWLRMGTGAGPTYDTGANYCHAAYVWNAGGSGAAGANAAAQIVLNYNASSDGLKIVSNWSYNGYFRLFNPGGSAFKFINGQSMYIDHLGSNRSTVQIMGSYESTTAVTAVQFLMSGGNVASGTIRAYGIAKT